MSSTGGVRRPASRYGDSPGHRALRIVLIGVAAVAFVTGIGWLAWQHQQNGISTELSSFRVVSDHQVRVRFEVHRSRTTAVVCTIQALAPDHSVVGELTVTIPAGGSATTDLMPTLRTERRATAVQIASCTRR